MSSSHLSSIPLHRGRFWEIPRKSESQAVPGFGQEAAETQGPGYQHPLGGGRGRGVLKYSLLSRSGVGPGLAF